MKKSFGAKTALFPLPVVLVGTYVKDNEPNLMAASWVGIINSTPAMLSISIRKERATFKGLELNKEFTLSFPNTKQIHETDYCGVFSQKNTDKISDLGLKVRKSDIINAPEFDDFNVTIYCKVKNSIDLGSHNIFISEIIDLKANESILRDDIPDLKKIDPIIYDSFSRSYFSIGNKIERAYTAKK